ncbi:MAG: hypothetical protein FWG29_02890 [Treponema sp.]|nr:hypothetical protein [Treponema sp.]
MKKHFVLLLPALITALVNCNTTAPTVQLPAELFFISQTLPDLGIPAEVGGRSENPEDETGMLRNAFREAYAEALLRNLNLKGVLGSDRVSPWPEAAPESWSQNWVNEETILNSWGIDNLVLALGSFKFLAELSEFSGKEKAFAYIFSVHGPILDMYGKSAGYSRANGVTGYGIPLGETFYSDGAAVQRFSRGRMIIAPEGSRFSFEDELFTHMIENLEPEEIENEFGGKNIPLEVSNAFIYTWAFFISEQSGTSDGPIVKISFPKPWIIEAGEESITIKGFYYKSYNKSSEALVLIDSEQLPSRAHYLYGSFFKAILSNKRLPGLETQKKLGSGTGTGLGKSLADGFALYGPPLSDPLPLPASKIRELSPETFGSSEPADDPSGLLFLEAQRFARGWIVINPSKKSEAHDDEPAMIWINEEEEKNTKAEMQTETEIKTEYEDEDET